MTLQIQQLRDLEDSQRVRTACLWYLQRWLVYTSPEHKTIVDAAQKLAREFGGEVQVLEPRWKYRPPEKIFGRRWAKKAAWVFPQCREWGVKKWDKFLFQIRRNPQSISLLSHSNDNYRDARPAITEPLR